MSGPFRSDGRYRVLLACELFITIKLQRPVIVRYKSIAAHYLGRQFSILAVVSGVLTSTNGAEYMRVEMVEAQVAFNL